MRPYVRLAVATLVLSVLATPVLAADQRAATVEILNGLSSTWSEAGFEAWVDDANGGAYRLGDPISFNFKARKDAYITLFYVDSYGVSTVLFARSDAGDALIPAGTKASIPSSSDGFELRVVPPAGLEDIFVIATPAEIAAESLGLAAGARSSDAVDSQDAPALARRLRDAMGERAAIVKIEQRIVGGTDEIEYTAREIVSLLDQVTTRGIPRALPMHLKFATGSDELTPNVRKNLNQMGKALQHPKLADKKVVISGHTDDVGDAGYNLELSRRRAEAVRGFLQENYGIAPDRIAVKAYGETSPLEADATPEARAANRRVEFEAR